MNITKESVGSNASKIRLEFTKEDFQPAVDKKLKEYRRKANIPGFRVGMAPMEVVKRMVGGNIVADEVNDFISKSLESYIKEEKLDLLGYPLSSVDNKEMDLDNDTNFVMLFDVAEMPNYDLNLGDIAVDYYEIEADDESVEKNITFLRERFGEETPADVIENKNDKVVVDYVQVDDSNAVVDGGLESKEHIVDLTLLNDEFFEKIAKLKVGDSIEATPKSMVADANMAGRLMGADGVEDNSFRFTVKSINKVIPAEMNVEFFNKVMPGKNIETVEAFRKELVDQSCKYFKNDADKFFFDSAMETIVGIVKMDLPFDFLKRWVETNSNGEITADAVEAEKENYLNGFKLDIIKSKIIAENNLAPSIEETIDFIKQSVAQNFYGSGNLAELDEESKVLIDRVASQVVNNEKEARRFYDAISSEKFVNFLRNNLKIEEKKVKSNEFSDIVMARFDKKK